MALTGYETRQERLRWLERPMDWAGTLSISASMWGIAMLGLDDLPLKLVIGLLSGALMTVFGLLIWQGKRLSDVAKSNSQSDN